MKRFLTYSFICLCSVFLMSHNVAAIDLVQNVVYKGSGSSPQWRDDSNSSASNTWHTGRSIYGGNSGNASSFSSFYIRGENGSNLTIENSWYIQLQGRVYFSGSNNKWNTSGNFIYTSIGNCDIVDMDTTEVQNHVGSTSNTDQIYNYSMICKYTGANNGVPRVGFKVQSSSQTDTFQFSVLNWFIWQYKSNSYDDTEVINAINKVRTSLNNINDSIGNTNLKLDDIKDALNTLQETQEKEENTANENIEQNQQDSNSSSSDAEDASQSLISAIGGFVSSITSASPSNCNIDGDMGNFDLGNIDLCANPVPTYIQIISSFILISLCIPFAIIMFNRFIALFRSFQT